MTDRHEKDENKKRPNSNVAAKVPASIVPECKHGRQRERERLVLCHRWPDYAASFHASFANHSGAMAEEDRVLATAKPGAEGGAGDV